MTTRVKPYFQPMDPNIVDDPDIIAAGAMAEFIYIRALFWIRRNRTFGTIPKRALADIGYGIPGYTKAAKKLLVIGLWTDQGAFWEVRNWNKWNMTKDEVECRSEVKSAAGRKGGHESKHSAERPSKQCSYCIEAGWVESD